MWGRSRVEEKAYSLSRAFSLSDSFILIQRYLYDGIEYP